MQPVAEAEDEHGLSGVEVRSEAALVCGRRGIPQPGGSREPARSGLPMKQKPQAEGDAWCGCMMHEWLEMAVEGGRGHTPKAGQRAWAFLREMVSQGRVQGQGVGRISLGHCGHWLKGGDRTGQGFQGC